MDDRLRLLHDAMRDTGTTQQMLARLSGVRQPSLSQMLSGRRQPSDAMLRRLLSHMGYELHVERTATARRIERSKERSRRLHQRLWEHLTVTGLSEVESHIQNNIESLRGRVRGQPHEQNLDEWFRLISEHDLDGLFRVTHSLDEHAVEMREVSPLGGLLTDEERQEALSAHRR